MITGVQITKVTAERKKAAGGKVSIDNNTVLKEVTEKPVNVKKQGGVSLAFDFIANYVNEEKTPVASIVIEADVLFLEEAGKAKEIVDAWKKNRTLDKELLRESMNAIMDKCNVAAILVARELNLPPPVPLPKIKE